jgi:50S ribosome-binding GTPase
MEFNLREIYNTTNFLWDQIKETGVAEWAAELYYGRRMILVFGCSGTGKTSLINSLMAQGAPTDTISIASRTQDSTTSIIALEGSRFRVTDTAGAQGLQKKFDGTVNPLQERDRGIFNRITRIGIINVVSYGYHEYSEEGREAFLTPSGVLNQDAIEQHRTKEIIELKEWATEIAKTGTVVDWVMTAVNKADLWQAPWSAVQKHYMNGEYQAILDEYLNGAKFIIARYCSVFHKFYGQLPMSGLLEESERAEANTYFLHQLIKTGVGQPIR